MLRHVATAAGTPHRCVVLPHIGANHPAGYFSAGTRCSVCNGHQYVSVLAVQQMAAAMGWQPAGHVSGEAQRAERLQRELELAQERIANLEAQLGAVEVLKLNGAVAARKPGRPKKAVA